MVGNIASEEDDIQFQKDLNLIYESAESNNMQFNNKRFNLLRYGQNEELKKFHTNHQIVHKLRRKAN